MVMIEVSRMVELMSGSVMRRNCVKRGAPSMRAAS